MYSTRAPEGGCFFPRIARLIFVRFTSFDARYTQELEYARSHTPWDDHLRNHSDHCPDDDDDDDGDSDYDSEDDEDDVEEDAFRARADSDEGDEDNLASMFIRMLACHREEGQTYSEVVECGNYAVLPSVDSNHALRRWMRVPRHNSRAQPPSEPPTEADEDVLKWRDLPSADDAVSPNYTPRIAKLRETTGTVDLVDLQDDAAS